LEEAEFCNNIILINAGKLIAEGNPKELKSNYLLNDILEVECSNPVKAMELLENQPFVEETTIFGNNLHLNVNNKFKSFNEIRVLLETTNQIKVKRIDRIVPTLEDVFIHLLDSENNV
jgi:ABC-2 type transport system ATP-binding protein